MYVSINSIRPSSSFGPGISWIVLVQRGMNIQNQNYTFFGRACSLRATISIVILVRTGDRLNDRIKLHGGLSSGRLI